MASHFHVITGGPGSGKTSLLDALAQAGFRCMPEAGRAIIRGQLATGGEALPWADRQKFAACMLDREVRSHADAHRWPKPVFFDRGIVDVVGYLRLCDLPVPENALLAARHHRYSHRVFIAPHWPEIFVQDAERKQTPAEAEATFHAMFEAWTGFGYELVPLPLAPVAERVRFVLSQIG